VAGSARVGSVDEGLSAVGQALLEKRCGSRNPCTVDEVVRPDPAPRRTLRAHGETATGEHRGHEVGQGYGVGEGEIRHAAGDAEPAGLTRQPQRHIDTGRDRGGSDGERLGQAFGVVGAARHLHDESAGHDLRLRRPCGGLVDGSSWVPGRAQVRGDPTSRIADVVEIVTTVLMVLAVPVVVGVAGTTVVRLYRGRD